METRFVHYVVEGAETEEAETDILVQVAVGGEGRFGVVEVQGGEVLEANYFIKVFEYGFK